MKIALLGYGKMGHEIENAAYEKGDEIHAIVDNEQEWNSKIPLLKSAEVAIEFSTPHTVISNIKKCLDIGIPVVVGTTGWYAQMDEVKKYCQKCNGSLLYASNFSIGVNIFFEINRKLASMLENYPAYKPFIKEIHHLQKLDAPSGTAITLAEDIMKSNERIKSYYTNADFQGDLHIESEREGTVPGTHIIKWESPIDILTLKHEAKNRKGFALGALMAAHWIKNKKGFYSIADMLK